METLIFEQDNELGKEITEVLDQTKIKRELNKWIKQADKKLYAHGKMPNIKKATIFDEWEAAERGLERDIVNCEDAQILRDSFKLLGFEPTYCALGIILSLCRCRQDIVIYATYIAWHASEKGMDKQLNISDVVDILAERKFSQKDMEELWYAQIVDFIKITVDGNQTNFKLFLTNMLMLKPEMLPKICEKSETQYQQPQIRF